MKQLYDLNLYHVFYVTANSNSFSEAAKKLDSTQPGVSYSIKKLEDFLDVKLFERTYTGTTLTEVGKILYYYVDNANATLASGIKIINEYKNDTISELNIGVPTHVGTYYISDTILKFRELYPNIKVNIIDKNTEEMINMIKRKKLDLIIDTDLTKSSDSNIVVKKIRELTGIFVANKEYYGQYANKRLLSKDFAKLPLILPSNATRTRNVIDSYFKRYNIALNPIIENNSTPIGKKLIEKGVGVGWMIDAFVKEELETNKFVEIKPAIEQLKISLSVMYQKENLNHIVKDFISILKEEQ